MTLGSHLLLVTLHKRVTISIEHYKYFLKQSIKFTLIALMQENYWFVSSILIVIRTDLHHETWSQTMEDGPFPWFDFMVQLPWSNSFKN
jgi:hypothetical protein